MESGHWWNVLENHSGGDGGDERGQMIDMEGRDEGVAGVDSAVPVGEFGAGAG
mgnify:CR=1 FL=1